MFFDRYAVLDEPAPLPVGKTEALAVVFDGNFELNSEELVFLDKIFVEQLVKLQQEFPEHFYSIHGRGLFISAHLRRPTDGEPDVGLGDAIVHEAVRRGVMLFATHRGFLKVVPPLCIEPGAAVEAVDVIRDCFIELKDS